ncbi:hypothetical protein [Paracoccus amoyensis]|uniref:hypothetical protein n=1 Tax=Paracoccus amoyensis TaxID=2760093 RepID=UPI00165985DC|nr:hypothetical protein [Paracoccus amoyensis]
MLDDIDGANMQIEAKLAPCAGSRRHARCGAGGQTRLADLLPGLSADFPDLTLAIGGDSSRLLCPATQAS